LKLPCAKKGIDWITWARCNFLFIVKSHISEALEALWSIWDLEVCALENTIPYHPRLVSLEHISYILKFPGSVDMFIMLLSVSTVGSFRNSIDMSPSLTCLKSGERKVGDKQVTLCSLSLWPSLQNSWCSQDEMLFAGFRFEGGVQSIWKVGWSKTWGYKAFLSYEVPLTLKKLILLSWVMLIAWSTWE